MSSWLVRSLAKSLQLDDQDPSPTSTSSHQLLKQQQQQLESSQPDSSPHNLTGVQEDLTEFTESLSRQIWGVASFLVPPPPPPPLINSGDDEVVESNTTTFREDGDGEEEVKEEDWGSVGVTEEVLVFAMNVANHPETWLDFPLPEEEEDSDDFEMSDTQWNHVTLVEHLVPRLAALRIELCPIHMSESYFWKVYFVLLHPRLNKHDADLILTPQIVAARAMWMKELQKETKPEPESFEPHTLDIHEDFNTTSSDSSSAANISERTTYAFEPTFHHTVSEKQPVLTKEDESTNDAAYQRVGSSFTIPIEDFGDDEDDWIHENSELDGYDGPDVPFGAEEDISFSDLEDDDYMKIPHHLK